MYFTFALVAILALTNAAPQYGYEPSTAFGGFNPLLTPQQTATYSQAASVQPTIGQLPQRGGDKYLPPAATTAAPIVNKKFYLVSAPEDHTNDGKTKHFVLGRAQKNYRVVFIKAPSSGNDNVKLSAEFAPQEEKTVIYVLSKKDHELEVNDIATPAPTQPSKPEVFFIKYKTDDEAHQAQREIQGQYDKLGGSNEFSDEGTAPITSVIGSLDGLNADGSYNYRQINNIGQLPSRGSANLISPLTVPNAQYLPSSLRQ